ncbi:hypothetical protein BJ170DRAFT_191541 [Xylariales sp. AK1849]|nr:hypothetical protein BJ170DRAFT_191541 [Xylariales sp. AK1849]
MADTNLVDVGETAPPNSKAIANAVSNKAESTATEQTTSSTSGGEAGPSTSVVTTNPESSSAAHPGTEANSNSVSATGNYAPATNVEQPVPLETPEGTQRTDSEANPSITPTVQAGDILPVVTNVNHSTVPAGHMSEVTATTAGGNLPPSGPPSPQPPAPPAPPAAEPDSHHRLDPAAQPPPPPSVAERMTHGIPAFHVLAGTPVPLGVPPVPVFVHQPTAFVSPQPYLVLNPGFVAPAIQAPPIGTGSWCYPNWRQSPFPNGTAHYQTNPPIFLTGPPTPTSTGQHGYVVMYP